MGERGKPAVGGGRARVEVSNWGLGGSRLVD
jgi:hypothetical protein